MVLVGGIDMACLTGPNAAEDEVKEDDMFIKPPSGNPDIKKKKKVLEIQKRVLALEQFDIHWELGRE